MSVSNTAENSGTKSQTGGREQRETKTFVGMQTGLQSRLGGRNVNGEVLTKAIAALNKNPAMQAEGVTFTPLDSNSYSLHFSVIVLSMEFSDQANPNERAVGFYTYILEGSNSRIPDAYETIGGKNVRIPRHAGDAYNETLVNRIRAALSDLFAGAEVANAGFMVVPADASFEDEVYLNSCLFAGSDAITNSIQELGKYTLEDRFSISMLSDRDRVNVAVNLTTREQTTNISGLPVRVDIAIDTSRSSAGQADRISSDIHNKSTGISYLGLYVDLMYTPPERARLGHQTELQTYTPKLVITRSHSLIETDTLEFQLFGLASINAAIAGHQYLDAFTPGLADSQLDRMHDFGAIGYEWSYNINSTTGLIASNTDENGTVLPFDMRGSSDAHRQKLLYSALRTDEVVIAEHVAQSDELSWLNSYKVNATSTDVGVRRDAEAVIIAAADRLTNNEFSKYWDHGDQILVDSGNIMHLGYWTDRDGERRDLREYDYLSVLNLYGDQDFNQSQEGTRIIEKWADTFDNIDIPVEIRMADRLDIIEALSGSGITITDRANELWWNPVFIKALSAACVAAGLSMDPVNQRNHYQRTSRGNNAARSMGLGGANSDMLRNRQYNGGVRGGSRIGGANRHLI
jgi:hypothetical protein